MCSLPIPERSPAPLKRYGEIWCGEHTLGPLVHELTQGKIGPEDKAHLDPDLDAAAVQPRPPGWRPLFGQAGAAERHLRNQAVADGDLFLFFGWFRRVEWDALSSTYRYVEGAPDLHCLFEWLQIAERVPVQSEAVPAWAHDHPHWQNHQATPSTTINALYLGADHLQLPGFSLDLPGGGVFRRYAPHLQLTAPDQSRSVWRLPTGFHPQGRSSALSYHANPDRWRVSGQAVQVHTVGRGQEFVLDCDHYPEAIDWLAELFGAFERPEQPEVAHHVYQYGAVLISQSLQASECYPERSDRRTSIAGYASYRALSSQWRIVTEAVLATMSTWSPNGRGCHVE